MYYRLEYPNGVGIFQGCGGVWYELLTPFDKLTVPKYLKNNPQSNTRSWFTEAGFFRFKNDIDLILDYSEKYHWDVSLVTKEHITHILSKGKYQVLESTVEIMISMTV